MKIQIGVIGPKDSMDRILYVAKEFQEISFIPYTYETLSDVQQILTNHRYDVDQWFFSGILNYTYAIHNNLITPEEGAYPPLHGSSFFGILLEAQLTTDTVFKRFSVDTITNEEFDKILSYYQLGDLHYYNHPFDMEISIQEIVQFHRSLYQQGKTEVVITSLRDVYYELQSQGIPVFRVTPSYLSIKLIIQFLEERAQSNLYRNSQVAIIGCRVEFSSNEREELYYSFKTKHKELDVKRQLLSFAEKTNGSLMQLGDGLFFIFTTRGELSQESEQDLFPLIEEIKLQTNIQMQVAIGFGETVSQAEQNVRLGFQQTQEHDKPTVLLMDENQTVTVKQQQSDDFSYHTVESGTEWHKKLKGSTLNPGVISKITSYSKQYGRQEFSSQDLSRWLKSTERNGRRILMEMERVGIVEQCGEAQSGERGRPRKVFRFIKD